MDADHPEYPWRTMNLQLTLVFRKVPEGYIGFVEELPGANSQGATLDEVRANLEEAVTLVLEANRTLAEQEIGGQDVIRETLTAST
jgi:predicted RNase H-like HicB family nuclease